MSYLFKLATIGVQLESSYGADAGVLDSDLFLAEGIEIAPAGEMVERPLQHGSLASYPHLMGKKWAELRFTTEVKGTLQKLDALFKACSMKKVDTTYYPETPSGESINSVSIYVYAGGNLFKLLGAVGTLELVAVAGDRVLINWDFRGLWSNPTTTALVEGSAYDDTIPPIFESTLFNLGGESLCIETLNLALNNTISTRVCSNSSSGVGGFIITARAVGGNLNPEAKKESDYAFFSDWAGGISKSLSVQIGQTDGNKITITCPKVIAESIAYGDRDGIRTVDTLDIRCYESSKDDEIQIEYTEVIP